ncbi:unnamed protein product [Gongylonema pulchrum]|uniref:Myotubularin phosphatase domain-containing protein n=1 Tax=Gongylonema pulchrum TaxID=637853 RepID=A0A183EL84_9BILA|nr:unnamed protein product [Gongylonema pulchrum]
MQLATSPFRSILSLTRPGDTIKAHDWSSPSCWGPPQCSFHCEWRSSAWSFDLEKAAVFFRRMWATTLNERLYVCPVKGTFSMNRSISYMNNQGKAQATKTSEETERQKKRREQSSAHRSRLIEQDPWTPLIMNCETDAETSSYCKSLFLVPIKEAEPTTVPDPEQLVQEAIIGVKMAAL